MLYSEDIITQVRESNDIVDVVGQHVRLEKKGANYFGLCPFHGEKTASFSVNPRKQICYCFGCHKGGNVVNFIMEYEHLSFPEAIRYLAERANITLPEVKESAQDIRNRELKERLLLINKEAAYFYHDKLVSPEGEIGMNYFIEKRRLSPRIVTRFGLGYAGKTPGELYRFLKGKGFADSELKESGLVTIEETGAKDKFWNRVMFPIMDINGKVIAFGGRVMGDGMPKYLNSPETRLFDKSSTLYGLNFARKTTEKYLLLCEGYMDVISLHQAGFTNAVASLGTAFTERHAKLLKRYTDTVILTQDSDAAGIMAKIRSFPILHDAGLKVKILDMGEYKDPDEFIKANGPDAYLECIRKAKNAFLVNVNAVKSRYDLSDPAQTTDYMQEIASMFSVFTDPLERDNYIKAVSREQMINYEDLKNTVERKVAGRNARIVTGTTAVKKAPSPEMTDRKCERSENLILYWLDTRPELLDTISEYIHPDDFSSGIRRSMAEKLFQDRTSFDSAAYLDGIIDEESRTIALEVFTGGKDYALTDSLDQEAVSKLLTEAVRTILSGSIDRRLDAEGIDMAEYQRLMREKTGIKNIVVTV